MPPGSHVPPLGGSAGFPGASVPSGPPPGSPGGPPPRSHSSLPVIILIATAVVGGVALISILVSTLILSRSVATAQSFQEIDGAGIAAVRVESSAAAFALEFGDVTTAQLEAEGSSRSTWQLGRSGDAVTVASSRDWCFFWCGGEVENVTLTLPARYNDGSLDLTMSLAAGSFFANGVFRDLDLEMAAGSMDVSGTAESVDVDVSAGSALVNMEDVSTASFQIAAGRVVSELRGSIPDQISIDVSAGSLNLTVPEGTYNVSADVAAGSFDNLLTSSPESTSAIDVDVAAGSVTLQPGR